ncbi:hypothetical protein BKA62DRAFT_702877 [Auriculariales sp. MPI-PUGE-AT-0066]|nr:hypothetical protein BKA62DRAFT_702877 [Auriculariales sp. MPI-PUGE-AT-0066]
MNTANSRVVFVGNVPYNMGEEQLIDVFRRVGQVVGFRLVFDRETGKPKGFGFAEFADHETALSAVRNLNNVEVDGRPLRIDLADSDPFLEGKTTTRGELPAGDQPNRSTTRHGNAVDDFLSTIPTGVPIPPGQTSLDVITHSIAQMRQPQVFELLAQMKNYVVTQPDQARKLLSTHPQLAYALFQTLLLHNIVDQAVLQNMLVPQVAPVPPPHLQRAPYPPHLGGGMPTHTSTPPPLGPPAYGYPPMNPMMPVPPHPPTAAPAPPVATGQPDTQKVLEQVLALTPAQIAQLPAADRQAIMDLRAKFLPPGQ